MRRLLASLVPLLLVAAGAVACSGAGADSPIVVLGPWVDDAGDPGDESDTVRQLLDAYGEKHGLTITYQGTRAIGPALRSKVRDGTLPDIAIMPTVGELASYATEDLAQKVTDMVHADPPPGAASVRIDHRALWRDREAYAVAVKTDLKSVILYRRGGTPPPKTWETLFDARGRAAGVAPWCMGMSQTSSSGWPGTDWIEDILLHQQGPQVYARWASGDVSWISTTVMQAWQAWGPVVRASNRSALLTTPVQAAEALRRGRCAMLHQSAFYVAGGETPNIDFFAFPAPRGKAQPGVEVAGDFAALFSRRPEARDLLAYLADAPTGGTDWAETSGGAMHPVNAQPQLPAYGALTRRVAEVLTGEGTQRCIDASDSMPATMAAAFHSAVLEYLADPDRLGTILEGLEEIRQQIPLRERLTVACTA